jgi:hypothetical protein
MTKPELYGEVALTRNTPEEDMKQGDVAVVVDYLPRPSGGEEGAILEVFNAVGETMAVVAMPISAVESLRADQVPAVRAMATARQ